MSTPDPIASIIELTRPYMAKATKQRPFYIRTLANGLEIEIKVPIYAKTDVETVMNKLLSCALCGAEHRSETHYIYQLKNGGALKSDTYKRYGRNVAKKKI